MTVETGVAGYKFDGTGFVVISQGDFDPQDRVDITFDFKTLSENGLIIFGVKDRDFLSVELSGMLQIKCI